MYEPFLALEPTEMQTQTSGSMASSERYRNYRGQIRRTQNTEKRTQILQKTPFISDPASHPRGPSRASQRACEQSARLGCDLGCGRRGSFRISEVGLAQNLKIGVEFVAQRNPCWDIEFRYLVVWDPVEVFDKRTQ
jgi:hypothetical protein